MIETNKRQETNAEDGAGRRFRRKLALGLVALALLAPIGLILPRINGGGEAFGEWGPDYFRVVLGYVPAGIRRGFGLWHAPASGYTFSKDACFTSQLLFYIASGLIGLLLVAAAAALITRIAGRRGE